MPSDAIESAKHSASIAHFVVPAPGCGRASTCASRPPAKSPRHGKNAEYRAQTELKPLISSGKPSPPLPFWQACAGIRGDLRSTTYRAASGETPSADLLPAAGRAPEVPLVAVSVQKNCDSHGQDGEMHLRNQRDATE